MLKSHCDVRLDEPRHVLERLCAHYAEHGTVEQTDDGGRIGIAYGNAVLSVSDDRLRMEVDAGDENNEQLAYRQDGERRRLGDDVGNILHRKEYGAKEIECDYEEQQDDAGTEPYEREGPPERPL
jgi:hypothetical protein